MTNRAKVVNKVTFVDGNGSEHRSSPKEATSIRWTFADGSEKLINPYDFNEEVRRCALFFGVKQKLSDSYGKPSGDEDRAKYEADPVGYSMDRFDAMAERLAEGAWVERAEDAGPRTTLLVEAIVRAAEAAGQPTNLDAVEGWLKSKTNVERKELAQDKAIAAMYAQVKVEKAAERARKLAEEAEGTAFDFAAIG